MRSECNLGLARRRRLLAGVIVAVVLLFGAVVPGQAKGPVAATIAGPGITEPMELVDGVERALVVRLMEQTGLWYATGDLPRPLAEPPVAPGPSYTLTWINGGPPNASRAERTMRQQIYVAGEGDLLIHTAAEDVLANWGAGVTGWFRAPSGLWATLLELGVPLEAALASVAGARAGGAAQPQATPVNTIWYLTGIALALGVGLAGALRARRTSERLKAE
jgi:hypothetical protein